MTMGKRAGTALAAVSALLFVSFAPCAQASPDPGSEGGTAPTVAEPAATPAPAADAASPVAATTSAPPALTDTTVAATTQAPVDANAADDVTYTVRLRDLEHRVNELKEQVFRDKARLDLLKETVLHQVNAASRARIVHRNEMGSMYSLIKLVYALDGAEIFSKSDDAGHLGDTKEFEIFNGMLVPGNHTLTVLMVYQGNGFGVFSYLKGYKFNVRASNTFTAAEGKLTDLKVVGFEKGNPITTDPKDRPAIDFRVNVVADPGKGAEKDAAAKPSSDAPGSSEQAPVSGG